MKQLYLSDLTTKMSAPCPAKAEHPPEGGFIRTHNMINPPLGGKGGRTAEMRKLSFNGIINN